MPAQRRDTLQRGLVLSVPRVTVALVAVVACSRTPVSFAGKVVTARAGRVLVPIVRPADWPTYGHDCRRSAVSTERLGAPLSEEWVFTPTHAPSPAWSARRPRPVRFDPERPRLRFDDAFHVAAVGDRVYFGSSSDNKVYALDAKTGETRWEFYTDGPVRTAPTVWDGRAYVGSDDGKVYCLDAAHGRVVWTFRAAPGAEKVMGNGKMVSLWPVRTGVLVDGGVAYFGAGVFPAEGLYLYAVRATDGTLLWKNDTYAGRGQANISPQGYMLASADTLFVSSGRAMPVAFRRSDGGLVFQRNQSWRKHGLSGGTYAVLAGGLLLSGNEQIFGLEAKGGRLVLTSDARRLVVDTDTVYLLTGREVIAVGLDVWQAVSRERVPINSARLEHERTAYTYQVSLDGVSKGLKRLDRILAELKKDEHDGMTAREREELARKRRIVMSRRFRGKKRAAKYQRLMKALAPRRDQAVGKYEALGKRLRDAAKWHTACDCADSMVLTRGTLFAGGAGVVRAFDASTGRELWSGQVNGTARGLAVANGRLLVSTDKGSIHCFAPGKGGRGSKVGSVIAADPFAKDAMADVCAKAADHIVTDGGVTRGYALLVGAGTGRLAFELAKRTDLVIYVVEPDATTVGAARKALSRAGVYGARVVVTRGALDALPCPDYAANLVVWDGRVSSGTAPPPAAELIRVLRPCGGVAYLGRPAGDGALPARWLTELRQRIDRLDGKATKVVAAGRWTKIVRGRLKGAGRWGHQYANPDNTACSEDQLVHGAMGVLWYGEPGPGHMVNRHYGAAAPLAVNGRLFVEGEDVVMAYDAYNGFPLWQRDIPGANPSGVKFGRCSNMSADDNSLFVIAEGRCLRLDASTGRTLRTYPDFLNQGDIVPTSLGYVACVGDVLYGAHRGPDTLFALDIETGKRRWTYTAKSIIARTICVGDGRLFYVDRAVTKEQKKQALTRVTPKMRIDRLGKPIPPDVRLVVALDARTGKTLWESPQYVSDCIGIGRGNRFLSAMVARNVLLLCGQPWNGHFWGQFLAGEFSRRSLIALAGDDGRTLWSGRKGYQSRPLIVGDRIVAEPWAHDLKTGQDKMRVHPVTGAQSKWQMTRPGARCGSISASAHALLFRASSGATYDLKADYGTVYFGGQRAGCWINFIAAGGLAIMTEASAGCVCPYPLQCTTVFVPRKTSRAWGLYSASGPMTPVRHLAVNLGAPGDRRDSNSTLWIGYPRPRKGLLVLPLDLKAQVVKGGGFFAGNDRFVRMDGTDDPWIYTTGCRGLARCAVPLANDDTPADYTVRLHFCEPDDLKPGERVFSVALQGRDVLKRFDIAAECGRERRAVVKTFGKVRAGRTLDLRLRPTAAGASHGPVLCGVEVLAERSRAAPR